MNFNQANVTKVDNGYVVVLQGFDLLTKQQLTEQYIAKNLDEAVIFLKGEQVSTSTIAV